MENYENINCPMCKNNMWEFETVGLGETWITCECGHEQEVFTSKQEDEINRHKEE